MKKMIVSVLLVLVLSIMTITAAGCHGLGETSAERSDRMQRQKQLNKEMVADDMDAIFQTDRPSRLSEYTIR